MIIHNISKSNLNTLSASDSEWVALKVGQTNVEVMDYTEEYLNTLEGTAVAYSMFDGNPVDLYYLGGWLRNDFNLGEVMFVKREALAKALPETETFDERVLPYALRLALLQYGEIKLIDKDLYTQAAGNTAAETDSEKQQFAYVDPRNREIQILFEQVCTHFLKKMGLYVDYSQLRFVAQSGETTASVVIPVRNREKTIADAVRSAATQKTTFAYNVIIVNNCSTDRTGEILSQLEQEFSGKVIVLNCTPEENLGIGGCWMKAVNSSHCGTYVVQLDSDDMYSDANTLQTMVDAFHHSNGNDYAAVVGSYRMTDFDLNTIPPGIIDHREWTDENGMNNGVRINGFGAPRAFRREILRMHPIANVSYGEDYGAMLWICRNFRIGRVYEPVYLCRRWNGNSDHQLSPAKVCMNNAYKDSVRTAILNAESNISAMFEEQLKMWPMAKANYDSLKNVESKTITLRDENGENTVIKAVLNQERKRSTLAKIEQPQERPCVLCKANRPLEQTGMKIELGNGNTYEALVNPYPIFSCHLTIVNSKHCRQHLNLEDMALITKELNQRSNKPVTVFYNAENFGASIPEHNHYQAFTEEHTDSFFKTGNAANGKYTISRKSSLGRQIVYCTASIEDAELFNKESFIEELNIDPLKVNVFARYSEGKIAFCIYKRKASRPREFYLEENERIRVSPASAEMDGTLIVTTKEEFDRIDEKFVRSLYEQV